MDVAVRTEAVLLQQLPISALALSLQEHPPPGANGCGGSHRGGAPTADPDLLVSSVLVGAHAPGANGGGGSHRGGAPTAGPDILVSSVLAGAPAPGANKLGTTPAGALLRRGLRDTAAPRQSPSHGTPAGLPPRPCARE